jgi:hypothetical protein
MYADINESQIKRKVIEIIRVFRSLGLVTDSNVIINELNKSDNDVYDISEEYNYKTMYMNDKSEKGIFIISLDKNLRPINVKITPK